MGSSTIIEQIKNLILYAAKAVAVAVVAVVTPILLQLWTDLSAVVTGEVTAVLDVLAVYFVKNS